MTTPKQQRNGVPGPSGVNSSMAQPGPVADFPQAQAEAAGNAREAYHPGMSGVPANDPHLDWDEGLAVPEIPGAASDMPLPRS